MIEKPKERVLSDLPDGQGEAVMRLVDSLTCLICDELDKYSVHTGVGIGVMNIVMAKMAGVSAANAGIDESEFKDALVEMMSNIQKNTLEFYRIKKEEMDDGK